MVITDTLFQASWISKPFVAQVALHPVEKDVLDLDADVNDVLRFWKVPESGNTYLHRSR
jgi:CubicO group peptidase (beta-lactamase class C family)